ncbi:MAG: NUDIX hydrolase [Simkaniaceae bacterium]
MDHEKESVNGIVFSEDRKNVLLIKRRDVPVWVLPGGGIEAGESPEEAAVREIEEETGYQVTLMRKIAEYSPLCRLARFTHLYECTIVSGAPSLSEETQGVAFFSLENLPPLPPPYPDWIQDAVEDHPQVLKKQITSVTYTALVKNLILHPILVIRFLITKIGIRINDK